MSIGYGAAARRAGQILAGHPVAWLPAVCFQGPLLVFWALWLQVIWRTPAALPNPLDRLIAQKIAIAAAALLWLAQTLYGAGYHHLCDRLLREERAEWFDLPRGALRLGPRFVAARLFQAGLLALVAPAVLLLVLRLEVGGLTRHGVLALWLTLAALAVLLAANGLRERSAAMWRAAVTVDAASPAAAAGRSARFLLGIRQAAFGRGLVRLVVWLMAVATPWILTTPLVSQLERHSAGGPASVARALRLVALAGCLALAASYLALADLVFYRHHGGPDGDARLATRGARLRRPRKPAPPPADGWTIASDPSAGSVAWPRRPTAPRQGGDPSL